MDFLEIQSERERGERERERVITSNFDNSLYAISNCLSMSGIMLCDSARTSF